MGLQKDVYHLPTGAGFRNHPQHHPKNANMPMNNYHSPVIRLKLLGQSIVQAFYFKCTHRLSINSIVCIECTNIIFIIELHMSVCVSIFHSLALLKSTCLIDSCISIYIYIWVANKTTYYLQWTWPKWVVPYRLWRFVLPCYVHK